MKKNRGYFVHSLAEKSEKNLAKFDVAEFQFSYLLAASQQEPENS
jgi:hypothetical protein